jgi:hypothetical protein
MEVTGMQVGLLWVRVGAAGRRGRSQEDSRWKQQGHSLVYGAAVRHAGAFVSAAGAFIRSSRALVGAAGAFVEQRFGV